MGEDMSEIIAERGRQREKEEGESLLTESQKAARSPVPFIPLFCFPLGFNIQQCVSMGFDFWHYEVLCDNVSGMPLLKLMEVN